MLRSLFGICISMKEYVCRSFKIGDGLWCRFHRAPAQERGGHGETFVQEKYVDLIIMVF